MSDEADNFWNCYHRALNVLAGREHSRFELMQKLQQKPACDDVDWSTLFTELEQDGYLSEERCAESVVRSAVNKGHGSVKIRQKMQRMRLSEDLIHKALDECGVDWLEQLNHVRCKRFGASIPSDYKERAKQARFLQSRGFESSQIRHVLSV